MQHPFQCLTTATPSAANSSNYLFVACGSGVISISAATGKIVSQWSPAEGADRIPGLPVTNNDDRPTKKQKTTQTSTQWQSANVIRLAASLNGQHLVVVTDDKCVIVFSLEASGQLNELSSRCMPKRPCAIQVLPDNATILCGDKFGDVYSLPLFPQPETTDAQVFDIIAKQGVEQQPKSEDPVAFKPSATNKTVHTQRNLKSLAAQQKQKALTPKTKEPLKFEHKLLLGHVSMLTDLTYATREVEGKTRGCIITADRDEHIRVSRGPPQSHVIEGYCLGHKEFVSKVCAIPGTELLLSGSGDDWLGLWNWTSFKLLRKISLRASLGEESIAVSGIWIVTVEAGDLVIVACEKVARLWYVPVKELLRADYDCSMQVFDEFDSPVLDVASIGSNIIVSIDARQHGHNRLHALTFRDSMLCGTSEPNLEHANELEVAAADDKSLDNLLYGIENFRKRRQLEEQADPEEADED